MSDPHAIATLLLNGAAVFFAGMLAGLPYGVLRVRQNRPEAEANWRIAHVQNLQNGLLLLLIGVSVPHLELTALAMQSMVYLLVLAAYCDMAAFVIRPVTGHAGLLPEPPAANLAVFALFSVTLVGQFVGVALVIYGAWVRWAGLTAA